MGEAPRTGYKQWLAYGDGAGVAKKPPGREGGLPGEVGRTLPPERLAFAANLQRARQAAGLTQAELADKSGVSQPHISALESGTWEPRLATIMQLARALGVEPGALLPPAGIAGGGANQN